MYRIVFISGLGANELAFSKIGSLKYEKIIANWIPNHGNESITEYAKRFIKEYRIKSSDILAGLSFGGVLAQEISKIQGNSSIILISSFKRRSHLNYPFRLALNIGLYRIQLIRIPILEDLIAKFLNSGNKESSLVLCDMLKKSDYELMNWSIRKIAEIKDDDYATIPTFNIVGTKDRIIRQWSNESNYLVMGGSHFMIYDKSDEVTNILNDIISRDDV